MPGPNGLWVVLLSTISASAAQLARAKTPEDRAKVDLKLHFMRRTLDEPVRPFAQRTSCQRYAHLPRERASFQNRLRNPRGKQISCN